MNRLILRCLAPVFFLAGSASAGLLSPGGIFVRDPQGSDRASFTNSERITLTVKISNSTASTDRVRFLFQILKQGVALPVFEHSGNSVPGTVGNSASQVSGIPISQFYIGPGNYTFIANATLDGQTVSQSISFAISSPNIILLNPSNGAVGVFAQPLSFSWISSGASRYRVSVDTNRSFSGTTSLWVQETSGGENFLTYQPTNSNQNLTTDPRYWKVEGLDASGNMVSESEIRVFTPMTASLTRDLAVMLETTGISGGQIDFAVSVANQGATTESNVTLRFSLGGVPAAGSPVVVSQLSPSAVQNFQFSAALPSDQNQSLAVACLEFFDDNVSNNCKTIQVTRPAGATADTGFGTGCSSSKPELISAIQEKLKSMGYPNYGTAPLSAWSLDDLCALLSQLNENQVQISYVGTPGADLLPPPAALPPTAAAPPPGSAAPLPSVEEEPNAIGREFAGVSLGSLGKDGMRDLVRDKKAFKRLWKRLSNEDAPDLDFKKVMLVTLAAGEDEPTDRFEVEDVVEGLSGLVVRYRAHGKAGGTAAPKKNRAGVPYMLKVVRSSGLDVKFEKVGGEGR